jgi:hypothetical protein
MHLNAGLVPPRSPVHVLALPMNHAHDEHGYSYLCSCLDMQPGLHTLQGPDSSWSSKRGNLNVDPDGSGQCH